MTSRDPAPLRRPRGLRFCGRVPVGLVAAALTVVIGTTACSSPAPTVTSSPAGSTGSASSIPAAGGQSTAAASPGVTGASPAAPSAVSQSVTAALQALLASTPQPSTAQIRDRLSAAGFAPAAVEVGVLGETECVMARIRSGTVESSVLPVLPNGRCFIGSVQR
jgi:hypothetical protein